MVAIARQKSDSLRLYLQIMFQDESRFGRINDIKRCWCFPSGRPKVAKQIIREYSYIYGAFSPLDGSSDMLILPCMTSKAMDIFLAELSKRRPDEFILLVCDGASNHRENSLNIPENIMILHLPPLSPELNPSENMWEEIKEKFFQNEIFASMNEVIDTMSDAIIYYESTPKTVKSITGWAWIVNAVNA